MDIKTFKDLLSIVVPKNIDTDKQHKAIAILSVVDGIAQRVYSENKIYFDSDFKQLFSKFFNRYSREQDSNRPLNPFFHLRSSEFWKLIPIFGQEQALESVNSVGSPRELHQLVNYACLDSEIFALLQNPIICEDIRDFLLQSLKQYDSSNPTPVLEIPSKFPHEAQALTAIYQPFARGTEIKFVFNHDLYDRSTNSYLECDLIAISVNLVTIVELKHWSGEIDITPNNWQVNGRYRKDPHKANKYKCQVLKGVIEKEFPYLKCPWVESVVVLTNPEATVHHDDNYKTKLNNPTFADTETLVKFFKYRLSNVEKQFLKKPDRDKIAAKLEEWQTGPRNKTLEVPGYEILENITQSDNRIELLARVAGLELQTIKRLRIFLSDSELSEAKQKIQKEKSFHTLKTLDQIGSHPNILKVEPVPNDDGLLIEVSDWTENGSLADVMARKGRFDEEEATELVSGIVAALVRLHQDVVVHRDLRPENILMDGKIPKLMNFDYTYLPDDHAPEYTVFPDAGALQASPFIAPELYINEQFDETADLFSVGVIFYRMLCGEEPFSSSLDLLETAGGLSDESLAKLEAQNISEPLLGLITTLIRFDREKRIQQADEVLAVLRKQEEEPEIEQKKVPRSDEVLQPGDASNVFEIMKFLGHGREAQVYKAREVGDRQVALKLFMQKVPRQRIIDERQNLEQLKNPYILHVHTLSKWSDGRFFLVTNLVNGPSMREVIKEGQHPSTVEFRHVAGCLLQALQAMHKAPDREKPLLHNDIKPDNILLAGSRAPRDPVLIDFGTACHPRISSYMGTDLYAAPDLLRKVDFEFCESGDLFALAVTLFEWLCGTHPYDGVVSIESIPKLARDFRADLPEKLNDWLDQAVQPKRTSRFVDILSMQEAFETIWVVDEQEEAIEPEQLIPAIEELVEEVVKPITRLDSQPQRDKTAGGLQRNTFVHYLNTLHNATAEDENSLAESQARNPFFGSIHIPLLQTDYIFKELTSKDGGHVILTGHAGDGKSTIGLELFKKAQHLDFDAPLDQALQDHEKIVTDQGTIHIIKDMSELGVKERSEMLAQAIDPDKSGEHWLIISNTGTMLSTFHEIAKDKDVHWAKIENDLLKGLGRHDPHTLALFDTNFTLINLAQTDNIDTAMQVFDSILKHQKWEQCQACDLFTSCPVQQNVSLLKENPLTRKRISMVYRRLKGYGVRLTMRQIIGHLAYSLTGGLDCKDIHGHAVSAAPPHPSDNLFSNRFFGHKGSHFDAQAGRLTAIQHIQTLEMGSKPFLSFDRDLWNETGDLHLTLADDGLKTMVQQLRQNLRRDNNSRRIRQSIRRLYYLFAEFGERESTLPFFLDSQVLLSVQKWLASGGPGPKEKADLLRQILHVLQEEFTGLQLGANIRLSHLYITLRRRQEGYRQSVQLLLAQIPLASFILEWRQINTEFPPFNHSLVLKEQVSGAEMVLDIPFLDFVLMRDMGEVGQRLNPGYKDRLEKLKSDLLRSPHYNNKENEQQFTLLELDRTGNLNTRSLLVENQQMQVM